MKKEISPVAAITIVAVLVLAAAALIWKGTQKQVVLPDKPPSGPIVLPPSQQGRRMPGGAMSGGALSQPSSGHGTP